MPEGYERLTARDAIAWLQGLPIDELEELRRFEEGNKARATVIRAIDERLDELEPIPERTFGRTRRGLLLVDRPLPVGATDADVADLVTEVVTEGVTDGVTEGRRTLPSIPDRGWPELDLELQAAEPRRRRLLGRRERPAGERPAGERRIG